MDCGVQSDGEKEEKKSDEEEDKSEYGLLDDDLCFSLKTNEYGNETDGPVMFRKISVVSCGNVYRCVSSDTDSEKKDWSNEITPENIEDIKKKTKLEEFFVMKTSSFRDIFTMIKIIKGLDHCANFGVESIYEMKLYNDVLVYSFDCESG